jgi:hypothetical protein
LLCFRRVHAGQETWETILRDLPGAKEEEEKARAGSLDNKHISFFDLFESTYGVLSLICP